MNKKLSICIPTYNRPHKLESQLSFLNNEFSSWIASGDVEIIVRDNNSDSTYNKIINALEEKFSSTLFFKNTHNVGLVNNLKNLEQDATGEYVWMVGDDDKLLTGIACVIMSNLDGKGLVFMNHNAIGEDNNIILFDAFDSKKHKNIFEIFDYSGTTMMFITACIYRRDLLHHVFNKSKTRLSLPLYASLYCSEIGGVNLIDQIYIENYWGETSWQDKSRLVFGYEVPLELLRALSFSKRKMIVMSSYVKYCFANYRVILSYWLRYR